jgi:hypothetical protein
MATPFPGLREPPIPGVELQLGEYLFFVPPMALVHTRQTAREGLLEKLVRLERKATDAALQVPPEQVQAYMDEAIDAAVTIFERSLKRNYPDVTRQEIEELLDMGNLAGAMAAVLETNGLVRSSRPTWPAAETPPPTPGATTKRKR